ncbi:lipoate--protein ligase family protein [Sporosarcina highlanderae]|uniref:lipoate--protein ligase family protein n=1 Tax=Sporosarcina highlanderae TaxID=3035916 RepID=UPI003F4DD7C5
MSETWGILDSGFHDAAINMALDEMLLVWHSQGKIPPTIRFYGWSSPSLTVGRFQPVDGVIDFNALEKHHCQFVRRMTGGSAVLHDNELTYSIIVAEDHPKIPESIVEAYYILSHGLLEGYKQLGIHADYAIPQEKQNKKNQTAVCFEKTAYYEMIVDGKKISGNAQTRKKGVLLQHGSIPMSIDEDMLFDLFMYPSIEQRQLKQNAFKEKVITIDQIKNRKHSYDELKQAFISGFQSGLGITLKPLNLTEEQWEEVRQLASSKYEQEIHSVQTID